MGTRGVPCFGQSCWNHVTPPIRVQVIPQSSGTTACVSGAAINAATNPLTRVGRMRPKTTFNAISHRLAIGSVIYRV